MLWQAWRRMCMAAVLLMLAAQTHPDAVPVAAAAPYDYLPPPEELPLPFRGTWARIETVEDETLAVARYIHQGPRHAGLPRVTLVMLAAEVKNPERTELLYDQWIEIWEDIHETTFTPLDVPLADAAVTAVWTEIQDDYPYERIRIFFMYGDVLSYVDSIGARGTATLEDLLDVATLIVEHIDAEDSPFSPTIERQG